MSNKIDCHVPGLPHPPQFFGGLNGAPYSSHQHPAMTSLRALAKQSLSIFLFPFILTGCGYTVRSNFPPDIKTIHIDTFANKIAITEETTDRYSYRTYRPLLEVDITNAVIKRFIYYGSLKVVKENEADLLLTGELKDFIRQPLRTSSSGNVEEYRLNLVVDITLKNTRKNEVMWTEEGLIGDTTYFVSGTQAKSEAQAVSDAINDLARRIADRVVEGW